MGAVWQCHVGSRGHIVKVLVGKRSCSGRGFGRRWPGHTECWLRCGEGVRGGGGEIQERYHTGAIYVYVCIHTITHTHTHTHTHIYIYIYMTMGHGRTRSSASRVSTPNDVVGDCSDSKWWMLLNYMHGEW